MKLDRFIRIAFAVLILVVFIVAVGALLFVTESALNIWARLEEGPRILLYGYVAVMVGLALLAVWLVWKLVVRRDVSAPRQKQQAAPLNRDEIETRLRDAEAAGVDVGAAQQELQELASRQSLGAVHLCFFGEISGGKSSLIKALVPDADVKIDVIGGSTADIRHYRWRNEAGIEVLLTDVPGIGGHDDGFDELAAEEARRAHVVLFVCDGDLTRAETDAVSRLLTLDKPLIMVLNKSDRYSAEEQAALMQRLLQHMDELGGSAEHDHVVAVSAGGAVEVVERSKEGVEKATQRQRPADIGVLVVAINQLSAG